MPKRGGPGRGQDKRYRARHDADGQTQDGVSVGEILERVSRETIAADHGLEPGEVDVIFSEGR